MLHRNTYYILLSLLIFSNCSSPSSQDEIKEVTQLAASTTIKHAKNFSVAYLDDGTKLVEVKEPFKGAANPLKYWLVPKDKELPKKIEGRIIVRVPIDNLVCTSTTHITPLDLLDVSDKLIGFPSTQYLSSEKVRQQVSTGHTKELGKDSNLNTEMLIELAPEMVMAYTMTGDYSQLEPIERIGIPVVQNAEYLEETPLGRAEWLKFVALFFNKEKEADSIFNVIEKNYLNVKEAVLTTTSQPTVLSGVVYGDTWYVPGGNSWAGKYLRDAGADFLWSDTESSGSLQLSFEAVYEKANKADYWIGAANYYELTELKNTDDRYSRFDAYTNGTVYTYNARAIENGGNDYFESGFSRPDIVLSDLVKILHPDLLPEHKLYYYRNLD